MNKYLSIKIALACMALIGLFLPGVPVVWADRYVVPTNASAAPDYETWAKAATNIQDAVNVATNGETVWLTNGTYFCQSVTTNAMVDITNSITLKSWSGTYSNTVISGNYPTWTTRVVYANNTGVVLDGLTISNGWTTNLSGAGVSFSGRLVTNCLITCNYTTNSASYIYPAGINMATGTISHSVIRVNGILGKPEYGAAIQVGASVVVSNCVITGNTQRDLGTGAAIEMKANSILANSDIYNNPNPGAAISVEGSNWRITSCTMSNNNDVIYFKATTATNGIIRNCLMIRNSKGLTTDVAAPGKTMIENCTITRNTLDGMRLTGWGHNLTNLIVVNSIIYYNNRANWVSNSGTNAVYSNSCTFPMPTNLPGLPEGTGNITNEPMFVDTNTNFRLSQGSPCINRGVNQEWMNYTFDLDGKNRIMERVVDMGAYESLPHNGTIIYIY